MRTNFTEAQEYFNGLHPTVQPIGVGLCELLHANFYLCKEDEGYLSSKFQSIVAHLGHWVAGDEKLFKFTGHGWLRYCPNKPFPWGIWVYMLCARMSNGLSYLLFFFSHTVESDVGERITCASIVDKWGNIVTEISGAGSTILVADSYYLDNEGRYRL